MIRFLFVFVEVKIGENGFLGLYQKGWLDGSGLLLVQCRDLV